MGTKTALLLSALMFLPASEAPAYSVKSAHPRLVDEAAVRQEAARAGKQPIVDGLLEEASALALKSPLELASHRDYILTSVKHLSFVYFLEGDPVYFDKATDVIDAFKTRPLSNDDYDV